MAVSTLIPAVLSLALAQAPQPSVRDTLGVNIHFTGAPKRDLDLLAEAGFGWVRMDLTWEAVERRKGVYDFRAYDALLAGLEARRIRALFILDYSNRLYERERSVRTEEGRTAFARFAAEAARRWRGKGVLWEIWNEPNLEHFWRPQPSAKDYLALVRTAAPAIRAADPEARIAAPAVSGIPLGYLEELFEGGLLRWVDVITVHPYRSKPPETVVPEYKKLRALIAKHLPEGRDPPPIASGEWGYSNRHWGRRIDLETQGAYLARMFLTNLREGVRLSIWYDWANDGLDPENTEHHFGVVTHDRRPKPAFFAAKTLIATLGDTRFARAIPAREGDHALLFEPAAPAAGGRSPAWLALWTEARPHVIRIHCEGLRGEVRAVDGFGAARKLEARDHSLRLEIAPRPVYLEIRCDTDKLRIESRGAED